MGTLGGVGRGVEKESGCVELGGMYVMKQAELVCLLRDMYVEASGAEPSPYQHCIIKTDTHTLLCKLEVTIRHYCPLSSEARPRRVLGRQQST